MNLLTIYTQKDLDAIGFISIFLAVLISCFLIFCTYSAIWLLFKSVRQNYSYIEYAIWSNFQRPLVDISNGIFVILSALAVFIMISAQIYSFLIHS